MGFRLRHLGVLPACDRLLHDLMRSVARRIVDRHVLRLIKLWSEPAVEERDDDGTRRMTGGKNSKRER